MRSASATTLERQNSTIIDNAHSTAYATTEAAKINAGATKEAAKINARGVFVGACVGAFGALIIFLLSHWFKSGETSSSPKSEETKQHIAPPTGSPSEGLAETDLAIKKKE